MAKQEVNVNSSFPVVGLLGVIFILCKVFEVPPIADWSWWWVLSPFWIGLAIFAAIFGVGAILIFLIALFHK